MVFVNRRLGNGFVIKSADSSKDQSHYFGGAMKHMKLRMMPEAYIPTRKVATTPVVLFHHSASDRMYAFVSTTQLSSSNGETWSNVAGGSLTNVQDVAITNTDPFFQYLISTTGAWTVSRKHVTGSAWTTVDTVTTGLGKGLMIHPSGTIFSVGRSGSFSVATVRSSSNGTTWSSIDSTASGTYNAIAYYSGNVNIIYAVGQSVTGTNENGLVRTSSLGGITGSWGTVFVSGAHVSQLEELTDVAIDMSGAVYVCGYDSKAISTNRWVVLKSHVTSSTTFDLIDRISGTFESSNNIPDKIVIHPTNPDIVYVIGRQTHFGGDSCTIRLTRNRGKIWYTLLSQRQNAASNTPNKALGITPDDRVFFPYNGRQGSGLYTLERTNDIILSGGTLGSSFSVTMEMPLDGIVDGNGVVLSDAFITSSFGINPDAEYFRIENPVLTFEISSSTKPIVDGDIILGFRDGSGSTPPFATGEYINMMGKSVLTTQDDSNYLLYTGYFLSGGLNNITLSGSWRKYSQLFLSASSGSFHIKNLGIEFYQPMTNDGVEFYKNLDNQNNEDLFVNLKYPVKKVV